MPETLVKVVEEVVAKPGWKTTEFWLAGMAQLIGILLMSGVIESGGTFDKAVALVVMALSSMGYSSSRASVKRAASAEKK